MIRLANLQSPDRAGILQSILNSGTSSLQQALQSGIQQNREASNRQSQQENNLLQERRFIAQRGDRAVENQRRAFETDRAFGENQRQFGANLADRRAGRAFSQNLQTQRFNQQSSLAQQRFDQQSSLAQQRFAVDAANRELDNERADALRAENAPLRDLELEIERARLQQIREGIKNDKAERLQGNIRAVGDTVGGIFDRFIPSTADRSLAFRRDQAAAEVQAQRFRDDAILNVDPSKFGDPKDFELAVEREAAKLRTRTPAQKRADDAVRGDGSSVNRLPSTGLF